MVHIVYFPEKVGKKNVDRGKMKDKLIWDLIVERFDFFNENIEVPLCKYGTLKCFWEKA